MDLLKFNKLILVLFFLNVTMQSTCNSQPEIKIIPKPHKIEVLKGNFKLTERTSIIADTSLISKAKQLQCYLTPATGYNLPINTKIADGNKIELKLLKELKNLGDEGYQIKITDKRILINASHPKGIFFGIQTLRQLLPGEILREAKVKNVNWKVPCVNIIDQPRFKWRGLMIDYSRTFWSVTQTKKYIDALSFYKMNKLHMHLTDDQGWRIEIDKYPKLTEIASKFDTAYNEPLEREGYFSKEDIKELVAYAKDRNMELIPEIEMPGHTSEIFAAYPELSCNERKMAIHPFNVGPGIHEEILCAGKEKTFDFLESVLAEVIDLFPSDYVHIGGDEAPKKAWENCALCQKRIEEEGLENEYELQNWFIGRIEKFLNENGKKLIGWDEITEGGLSKTATVMFWRGWKNDVLIDALKQGNFVILSPTTHSYFDYSYEKISIEKVYNFELQEIINEEQVLGVQANFWSHIDRTVPKMDRQIFPRLLALAEVCWSKNNTKDWNNFSARLNQNYKLLDLLGIYYFEK